MGLGAVCGIHHILTEDLGKIIFLGSRIISKDLNHSPIYHLLLVVQIAVAHTAPDGDLGVHVGHCDDGCCLDDAAAVNTALLIGGGFVVVGDGGGSCGVLGSHPNRSYLVLK